MQSKSGWSLFSAVAITCLAFYVYVVNKAPISPAPVQSEPEVAANDELVKFAAAVKAEDVQQVSLTASSNDPFPLPNPSSVDPVIPVSWESQPKLSIDEAPQQLQVDDFEFLPIEDELITDDSLDPIFNESDDESLELPVEPFQVTDAPTIEQFVVEQSQVGIDDPNLYEDSIQNESPIQVQEDEGTQEPDSQQSPFKLASTPIRLNYIKLNSEVVTRRRSVSQPIGEISIPEWNPKAAWAKPTAIITELEKLEQIPATADWAQDTKEIVKALNWTRSVDDPQAAALIEQLSQQLHQLNQLAISVSTVPVTQPEYVQGPLAIELRSFHYDIARRLMIWSYTHQLAKQQRVRLSDMSDQHVLKLIQESQSKLDITGVGSSWSEYLQLKPLSAAFGAIQPDEEVQCDTARVTLSRLYSPVLSKAQKQFLSDQIDDQLIGLLREKASQSIELPRFTHTLEKHEYSTSGYTSHKLNGFYQSLLWSTDPASQSLAGQLEGHYRNANFRVSVSDQLINRLLPQTGEIEQPIQDNVMGAQVFGNSRIQNRLLIRLIPDNRKVNLWLEANGKVRSLTQARQSGFRVDNLGHSRYRVFKQIAINRSGVETDAPHAVSDTSSQIIGMSSNLDPIPVVGWVARKIARNKIQESAPMTDMITRQKVEAGAKEQMESEVQSQLAKVSDYLFVNFLQPMIAMDLEPTPVEMRTTSDRVIMRYRLAGRDQMAAHTARPQALADSLMSFQLHESVFNNLFDRIEIAGRSFTAVELSEHLTNVFGSKQAAGSEELNHEAYFEFAPYDPIRVEFKDSKFEMSINLKKFRVGKGKTWKNLNVKATFNPHVEGSKLYLLRDESGIRLKGSNLKLRDQVAVRTVFTALVRDHYKLNVLPENFGKQFGSTPLEISQLVLNDGWLGVSFSDPPRAIAQQPAMPARPRR